MHFVQTKPTFASYTRIPFQYPCSKVTSVLHNNPPNPVFVYYGFFLLFYYTSNSIFTLSRLFLYFDNCKSSVPVPCVSLNLALFITLVVIGQHDTFTGVKMVGCHSPAFYREKGRESEQQWIQNETKSQVKKSKFKIYRMHHMSVWLEAQNVSCLANRCPFLRITKYLFKTSISLMFITGVVSLKNV